MINPLFCFSLTVLLDSFNRVFDEFLVKREKKLKHKLRKTARESVTAVKNQLKNTMNKRSAKLNELLKGIQEVDDEIEVTKQRIENTTRKAAETVIQTRKECSKLKESLNKNLAVREDRMISCIMCFGLDSS